MALAFAVGGGAPNCKGKASKIIWPLPERSSVPRQGKGRALINLGL